MNVEAILRGKGRTVATIRPDQPIAAALTALRDRNIGALVVSEDGERVDGIHLRARHRPRPRRHGAELLR